MIPGTRANATVATTILSTLDYGDEFDSTSNGTLPLMSFFDDIADELITAVTATLVGDTATISTAGLGATSIAQLTGIRTRVDEAVAGIYGATPNISPYRTGAGVELTTAQQANRRDQIIQAIFNYDGRYFLRQRAGATQGGFNEIYELPSRHGYMDTPVIEALLGEHGLTRLAGTVDDNGAGGTYRITTTVPHGTYDGISYTASYFGGNSAVSKPYWLDGLSQSDSANGLGTDTASRFRFNANIGTNYLVDGTVAAGSQILAQVDLSWIALNYQPTRYFKLVDSGAAFEFYYDSALTDQLIPGFGYVGSIAEGFDNGYPGDGSASGGIQVNTSSSTGATPRIHLIFEDIPQMFEPPSGWTGNASIYETRPVASVNPGTDVYTVTQTTGSSIYNGQLVNARQGVGAPVSEWSTWALNTQLQYFNRYLGSESQVQLYTDAALTQVYQLGVEAGTITSITYPGGNAQLNFSSAFPPLIGGMVVRMNGTSTAFSGTRNADAVSGTTPFRITLDANHSFQNSQPIIRTLAAGGAGGQFYVKTTGLAANEIEIYTDPALTTAFQAAVNDDFGAQYFVKRIANSTWGLYVDAALTVPFTTVIDTTGFTTGSMVKTMGINSTLSLTAPADMRLQPQFYCRLSGLQSATLWVDAARTQPYAYRFQNGILGTVPGMPETSVSQGLVAGAYRIGNQSHAAGFTANIKPQAGYMNQVFWVDSVAGTALDLYVNSARSVGITTPAIASPQTIDGMVPTYLEGNPRYRIETFASKNIGGATYFYDSTGSGLRDTVEASWGYSGQRWYTPDTATNTQVFVPNIIVEEYRFANAGAYYGHLRRIEASGTVSNTSPAVYSTSSYGGVGTGPCVYSLGQPGAYMTATPFIVGIGANVDVIPATLSADDAALANTAPEWDTLTNVEDRTIRQWPTTTNPVSLTWTIEKPTQSVESVNLTRYNRSRDVSRYRIRAVYPPMKIDQIQEYLTIINASRGAFKQMKLQVPIADTAASEIGEGNAVTIRYYDRRSNAVLPAYMRIRNYIAGGSRVIECDGGPVNYNATVGTPGVSDSIFGAGHPVGITQAQSTTTAAPDPVSNANGSWYMPIHNVETNSYGEFNMRLANGVPEALELGDRLYRDAGLLNVFLDGNTVEIKVDVLGYHYMEIEFITGKIF